MRLATAANRRALRSLAARAAREDRILLSVRQPPKIHPARPTGEARPDTELRAWACDPFRAASVLRRRLLASQQLSRESAVDDGRKEGIEFNSGLGLHAFQVNLLGPQRRQFRHDGPLFPKGS